MADKDGKSTRNRPQKAGEGDSPCKSDMSAEVSLASRNYWNAQDEALVRARNKQRDWAQKRRARQASAGGTVGGQVWKRESYSLPRKEAQKKAREFLKKYPKAAYWSEVESWRELPGDVIEFTMRRLPTAD